MKKFIALSVIVATMFCSCQFFNGGAPSGYTHIKVENGKAEFNVPKDFSQRKDTSFHYTTPQAYDVKVFKFTNVKDTAQAIVFTYSINANSKLSVEQVTSNVAMGAAQNPTVKLLGNDTTQVNGQKCAIISYTMLKGADQADYSRIILTTLNQEVYSLNLAFKGPMKPEYNTIAENVTKSFKIKK